MCEPREIENLCILVEDVEDFTSKLNYLQDRLQTSLQRTSTWDNGDYIALTQEALKLKNIAKSICENVFDGRLSEHNITVRHIWHIIRSHSNSAEAVTEGKRLLEQYFKLKLRSMIKPTNYLSTIVAYIEWQYETVYCFVNKYRNEEKNLEHERLWNWNYQENEKLFFGGAARPLHLKRVTGFASVLSVYYEKLWPRYKENRAALADALFTLLYQESRCYWPNYEIFPCNESQSFSGSDYIPFVHSAQETFAEKFLGSDMTSPENDNTLWILENLKKRCSKIRRGYASHEQPTILILLTSKNRYGYRLNVDLIHERIIQDFPTVITIVDACQDGHSFTETDIIIYSKRFTPSGAFALINKEFLIKNSQFRERLKVSTNFSVGILAELYSSINMINKGVAYGVEDLTNSSRWYSYGSPIQDELRSTFSYSYAEQDRIECTTNYLTYSFNEDPTGTIVMITMEDKGETVLPKLWALLKQQGHSLDCFVMDNPYLSNTNGICSEKVRELISGQFIHELRKLEAFSSDYLAWPLVPYSVSPVDNITVEKLTEYFNTCYKYHCCLRISLGRSSYPGKLKRFVDHLNTIFVNNQLDLPDVVLGKHASQWLSKKY